MSRPPVFGPEGARWSLGSFVMVSRWENRGSDIEGFSVDEVLMKAKVVGMRYESLPSGEFEWVITVSFGPALDLMLETECLPASVTAIVD